MLRMWLLVTCACSQDAEVALLRDDECGSAGDCSLNALQVTATHKAATPSSIGPCDADQIQKVACEVNDCTYSCNNFFDSEKQYLTCSDGATPASYDCRQYGCSYKCGPRPVGGGGQNPGGGNCRDQDANCVSWAAQGECSKNPNYMLSACKASCGNCAQGGGQSQSPPQSPPQQGGGQSQSPPQSPPQQQLYPAGWCTSLFSSYGFSPSQCRKADGGGWYQWICSSNGATHFCDSSCHNCNR